MRQLKFQHVFTFLMIVSFAAAFVFPRYTKPLRPHLHALFAPIARPSGAFGAWLRNKFDPKTSPDDRPLDDVRAENDGLRVALANIQEQLILLKRINADRELLGQARALCTPVQVVGGDSGDRDTLSLGGSTATGLRADAPVLYTEGIAGRVTSAGVAGATVRLITDKDFALTGSFCRYERSADGGLHLVKIATPPVVVKGVGNNRMVADGMDLKTVRDAKVAIGDWIILDDSSWPEPLRGYRVGKVVDVGQLETNALFAKLRIEPQGALTRLTEVMVMTKTSVEGPANGARP